MPDDFSTHKPPSLPPCQSDNSVTFRVSEHWGCLAVNLASCPPPNMDGWPILKAIDYLRACASDALATPDPPPPPPPAARDTPAPTGSAVPEALRHAARTLSPMIDCTVRCPNTRARVKVAALMEALAILAATIEAPACDEGQFVSYEKRTGGIA